MIRGRRLANCLFNCGVMLGLKPAASFSNSALVMVVLQSAAGVFVALAGFAAVPLAAAGLGCAGQTPWIVITTAVGGTAAAVSGSFCAPGFIHIGPPGIWECGGGVPGAACPQANVANRTHNSQLLRIRKFLQDWST